MMKVDYNDVMFNGGILKVVVGGLDYSYCMYYCGVELRGIHGDGAISTGLEVSGVTLVLFVCCLV